MLTQKRLLKNQLSLNPRQLAQLHLYQMDQLQLEQRIALELEENPFLEEASVVTDDDIDPRSPDEAIKEFQSWEDFREAEIAGGRSLSGTESRLDFLAHQFSAGNTDYRTELKQQLDFLPLSCMEKNFGYFLIDSCNEHGFLQQDIQSLADLFSFKMQTLLSYEKASEVLQCVQQLEPGGIGCSNVKEFYLWQLRDKDEPLAEGARRLLQWNYDNLSQRKWQAIKRDMARNDFDFKACLEFVKMLKAAPVEVSVNRSDYVVPDFIITIEDDHIHIRLNQRRDVVFNGNSSVDIIVPSAHNGHRQENSFWRERYQSAKWFANALRERERNMLSAMHAIVELQKDFFLTGQFLSLKPMILKNIAEKIKLDIPTVSRLLANKYAHTLFGTISLKQLFSEGVPTRNGELVSGKIVEARISSLVKEEDKKKPLTDKEITEKLCAEGFLIARRTVSKYRVRLQIPVCKMRGDL